MKKQIKIHNMYLKLFIIIFSFLINPHLFVSKKILSPLDFQSEPFAQRKNLILMAHGRKVIGLHGKKEPLTVLTDDFGWWMKELKANLKRMNADNFISLLEKKICPGLRQLKEKKISFTGPEQKKLLTEIVAIYGKVLNYSKDNNYFYCLYHYSGFPGNSDIFGVALDILTDSHYDDFVEILNSCHKQEIEGNGDNIYTDVLFDEVERFSEFIDNSLIHLLKQGNNQATSSSFLDWHPTISRKIDYLTYADFPAQSQEPVESELVDYFSNLIFENTSCRCRGNNRCTRGCVKGGVLPQVRCRGRKNRKKTTLRCMGYVNGAIMATVHSYFDKYCPNQPFSYVSCLDTKGGEGTLCEQGFVFPSALCGLNLDGKGRFNLIRNKSVRKNCKNWFRHNGKLVFVDVSEQNGNWQEVPLFQKIDMPEDPEDLPSGTIIVSASDSIHGHIEIKTDKRECGKKKKDICFCSDFCDSRKGGYKWPFRPQVVFQWHPEFIRLFGNSGKLDSISL